MKTKYIFILSALFIANSLFAQNPTKCASNLSIFSSFAKNKNYTAAEPYYAKLVENCPSYHIATYQYGGRMLNSLIDSSEGAKQKEYAQELIKNYTLRLKYFPEKTEKGEYLAKIAQIKFDYKLGTSQELFNAFDEAWKTDKNSFESPKSLYTYFSLLIQLHDAGKKDLQAVFVKYDEVMSRIVELQNAKAEVQTQLLKKQKEGTALTSRESRILKNTDIYLSNYSKIQAAIKGKLGKRADCENLIPLYQKDFEANKNNLEWVTVATNMLNLKECTDSDLFLQLVEAQQRLKPSAATAKYLGMLARNNGQYSKALEYFTESLQLETNSSDKANLYYYIANVYQKQGRFARARSNYRQALKYRASFGSAYLQIAAMYAKSANDCGKTTFEKKAVYWIAAEYAKRAGRVNPSIRSSAKKAAAAYAGRAPQRTDIFSSGKAGQTITVGCWINETVQVPTL